MHLINLLKNFKRPFLFTTPSHCGVGFGDFAKLVGQKVFGYDFSEIDNLDNIRNPQGILKKSQEKAAEIYDSKASFYLYNGSTSGILALMLSILNENDKVLIPRNSHISVLNGLILSRAEGVFFEPESDLDFDVPKPISPSLIESKLAKNNDVKALIITNPTYEGVVSDVPKIAQICEKRGIILIVDEAHGALWNFSDKLPISAILAGADASVQSLHKTAGALTQSSILHISKNSKILPKKVQESLNLINSTSPSYLLLASIESAIAFLTSKKGAMELDKTIDEILKIREKLSKIEGVKILENKDFTKIFLKIERFSGYELSERLSKYHIEDELANEKGVLLLCGLGTSKQKLDKLYKAVKKIV